MSTEYIYCITSDKTTSCSTDFDMMVGNPWVNFEPEPAKPWYQDITQIVTDWFMGLSTLQIALVVVSLLFAAMLVRHVRTFDHIGGRHIGT